MPAHIMQFDSISALLACIAETREQGEWRRYQDHQGSLDSFQDLGSLSDAVGMAQTLHGLESEIDTIDTLAQTLSTQVPAPASVRRVPAWGRSGTRVSVNRVMAGNLGHAWRRTERQARPQHGRVLTLLVPCSFSAETSASQIRYTCAASLAYAQLCAQAGYSLDVWACIGGRGMWADGTDCLTMVRLLAAGQAWQTQGVALSAHAVFLRRVLFRAWEQTEPTRGNLAWGYGHVMAQAQLVPHVERWAALAGMETATLVYGAGQEHSLTTPAAAQRWLTTQLSALAA